MFLASVFACFVAGCASNPAPTATPPAPVILISLDGFRWDYLAQHPAATPRLRALAAAGVQAEGLIPVFPSNTFPNHYTIVTGLYPSHSGVINNRMFDAALGEFFIYKQPRCNRDSRWWGGEPVWITAVKQGRPSACSFWPGSEAPIGGRQATHWKPFDYRIPFSSRLEELAGWLKQPVGRRPAVAVFYLEEANGAGHKFGPNSPELVATLKQLDDAIGAIVDRVAREGLRANFVVVSDHGMAECGSDRVILLDDFLDLGTVQVEFDESVCGLRPTPGNDVDSILRALARLPHARVYRSEDLPARLRIDARHPRVPPIWILPDEGWNVTRRAVLDSYKDGFLKGQHGYDPEYRTMHGILIASGPAFRSGVIMPRVENIHIYNLLCAAAGLTPAANDGDNRLVRAALK